jgi:hypothetical protein
VRAFLYCSERKHTILAGCVCWVVGVENEDVLVGSNCGCGTRAKRVVRTKRARDVYSKINVTPEYSGRNMSGTEASRSRLNRVSSRCTYVAGSLAGPGIFGMSGVN